nr:hypothetical protein [Tanacetum cinerariifolium]
MADVNVNAPAGQAPTMAPPMRTDDQILPHIRWVPIGKSSCYLDVAFTTSSTIPSVYIQQFWDTVQYDKSVGCYRCQLDEQWFDLTKDTLRDALQITPVNDNQAFTSPPSSDALINFVNKLGYPKLVRNLSNVKSPADRYIFQRPTSTPNGSSGHDESSSLYTELGLTDSDEESQEDVHGADVGGQGEDQAGPDPGAQAKGQVRPDPGAQDEGQAGSNPDEQPEGQAGPDPGNAEAS